MSGETENRPSGWSVDTLKVLMDERQAHLRELRVSDQRAIDAALVSQEKAIVKAENAAEKRFELLNELRDGVATKEQLGALEKEMGGLAERITRSEGAKQGSTEMRVLISGAVLLVLSVLAFIGIKL